MTDEFKKFLTDYLAWVDAGAPEGNPFTRRYGLCFNAEKRGYRLYNELERILDKEFSYQSAYPFGGYISYMNSSSNYEQHLNQKRIDWIKSKLE